MQQPDFGVGLRRFAVTQRNRWAGLLLPMILAALLTLAVHYASAHYPISQYSSSSIWGGPLPGNTTMHPAGNPHVVNTDLIVPAEYTLTIEPGVELYFAPSASLIVYGRLLAEGAPTQTILFTHRDAGAYWGAIALLYTQADNRITHAIIEYTDREEGAIPRSYGVTAYSARVTLADSILRYTLGKDGPAVVADWDSTLVLLRNEIHDIGGDGVHPTGGAAIISGNHIYNARWGGYFYEGIEISHMTPESPALVINNHVHDVTDDCLDVNSSWVVVECNRLHDCADKGISIGTGSDSSTQPSSATVVNNLVYASVEGIAVKDSAAARIVHNTVVSNTTGLALYEAWDHEGLGGGRATVVNTILWGNGEQISLDALSTVTVTYSIVGGNWPGDGNLDADPLFVGPDDYHLGDDSPAINAGRDEGIAVDLDGQPRPVGGAPDMGAYEYPVALTLWAWPGDTQAHLSWQLAGSEPALTSFTISYTRRPAGSLVFPPTLITGLPTTTRAYTLTGLVNYAWYTAVVEGWDVSETVVLRSNAAAVMPTDLFVYLPLTVRASP